MFNRGFQARTSLIYRGALLLLVSNSLTSCSFFNNGSPTIVGARPTKYLEYTVKNEGETLTQISKFYSGSAWQVRKLTVANPRIGSQKLEPGMIIKIPTAILKKEFRSVVVKQKTPVAVKTQTPTKITTPLPSGGVGTEILPGSLGADQEPQMPVEKPRYDKIVDPFSLPMQNEAQPANDSESTPQSEIIELVPTPVPVVKTPEVVKSEEEQIRDQYRDIMRAIGD